MKLAAVGIALGAGVVIADRVFHKLPDWLARVLFVAALALIIAGMIVTRDA